MLLEGPLEGVMLVNDDDWGVGTLEFPLVDEADMGFPIMVDDKLALIVGISNWNVGWELLKGAIVENGLRYFRFFLILVLLDLSSP